MTVKLTWYGHYPQRPAKPEMTVNGFSQCQSSEEESKTCHWNIFIVRPLLLFCKMNTIIKGVNWLHAQWQMKNQQSSHINPSCKEKYVHLFEKCSESQIDYRKDCEPGSKLQLRPKPSSSKIDSSAQQISSLFRLDTLSTAVSSIWWQPDAN